MSYHEIEYTVTRYNDDDEEVEHNVVVGYEFEPGTAGSYDRAPEPGEVTSLEVFGEQGDFALTGEEERALISHIHELH